jgi:hypothetical protein
MISNSNPYFKPEYPFIPGSPDFILGGSPEDPYPDDWDDD